MFIITSHTMHDFKELRVPFKLIVNKIDVSLKAHGIFIWEYQFLK